MIEPIPHTPSFQLTGKRALVAGASSGIGLGCAVALCEVGASVTILARSTDKLQQLQQRMQAEGWSVNICTLDVTDLEAVQTMIVASAPFDILVNRDCTVPFIRISDLTKSINLFKNKRPDAVYGVYRQHFNPYFNMMETSSSGFLKLSKKLKNRPKSRQEAPVVYQLNGLFVFDVKKFLKELKLFVLMPRKLLWL